MDEIGSSVMHVILGISAVIILGLAIWLAVVITRSE
mgnify:CR=1 FL=1